MELLEFPNLHQTAKFIKFLDERNHILYFPMHKNDFHGKIFCFLGAGVNLNQFRRNFRKAFEENSWLVEFSKDGETAFLIKQSCHYSVHFCTFETDAVRFLNLIVQKYRSMQTA